MKMRFIRRKGRACLRLLLGLALAAVLTAGGMSLQARAADFNSSGNQNVKLSVDPIRKSEGFSTVLYDNRNGLPTSEANAISQTSEGFIWIGSYSGLIRYDGDTFERIDSKSGISNVRCLYVDSQDRLWIGTNDNGVFVNKYETLHSWNKKDGLKSVSIRAITEDEDGVIYVATTDGVAMIHPDWELTAVEDERLAGQTIRDLRRGSDGLIYGLTQPGDIFTIQDGKIRFFMEHEECRIDGILAILPDPKRPGDVYIGTAHSQIFYGTLERNFATLGMKDMGSLNGVERFEYINGQIWVCCANGIGRLDAEGFSALRNVPMYNSVGHVMTDYEGNLWFTSTRQGVMKIVPNQFSDLFERYGLPTAVVNSTCMYRQQLFIGTDSGLIVTENRSRVGKIPLKKAVTASGADLEATDLLELLDGERIRSIIRDSQGRIWISTWRSHGLICYRDEEVTLYTPADGLLSNQVRTVSECEDGSLLVIMRGGVCVLRGNRIVESYGEEDGILMSELLTVTEGYNHEVVTGSDGGGIYVITPEGTRHIGTEDGLTSEIILRIKRDPVRKIFWVVTSNSLAYMTEDFQVTTIREFPYSNNYDLFENSKGDVWVISSAGIYVLPAEELLANEKITPVFFGISSGLPYTATANAFSELTDRGELYIASMAGVVTVNIETPLTSIQDMKVALPFIDGDGIRYYPDSTGTYVLPGNIRKLTVYPYVFNFLPVDPKVSLHLEGFDANWITVNRSDMVPLDYTNLPNREYRFVIEVEDPVGHLNKTVAFRINKGKDTALQTAGTLIMNITSLFFMGGLLIYTSLARRRGRTDDKLFQGMIICNAVLAVTDCIIFLLEGNSISLGTEMIIVLNMVFYSASSFFAYLSLMYLDYRLYKDKNRLRKLKMWYLIPCLALFILLVINLWTGWLYSVGEDNILQAGPWNILTFLPLVCYFPPVMRRLVKINLRPAILVIFLILARVGLGIWVREISSTAFIYTLFLVCMHLYRMNRLMNEEAPKT